jgi:hypothetical protein
MSIIDANHLPLKASNNICGSLIDPDNWKKLERSKVPFTRFPDLS